MKKINEIIKSKPVQYIIVACAGLLVGWLLFDSSESPAPATHEGHEMHEGHSHDPSRTRRAFSDPLHAPPDTPG